jgi:hypothetical protein
LGVGASVTLGSDSRDKLTINSVSQFNAPITVGQNALTIDTSGNIKTQGSAEIAGNLITQGLTEFKSPFTLTSTSTPQLSIRYDELNKLDISVFSTGAVSISSTATTTLFAAGNQNQLVLSADGNVGIGTATPAYKLDVRETRTETSGTFYTTGIIQTVKPPADSSAIHSTLYLELNIPPDVSANFSRFMDALFALANFQGSGNITYGKPTGLTGIFSEARYSGTGTLSKATGLAGEAKLNSSGTLQEARGVVSWVRNLSTGTLVTGYGYDIYTENTGGGTFTNFYGFRMPTLSGITNKWGVYIEDSQAKNYFAGNVGIGTTTIPYKLTVNGDLYVFATSTLGSATSTPVIFGGYVQSNIIPYADNQYTLGLPNYRWANIFAATGTFGGTITIGTNTIQGSATTTLFTSGNNNQLVLGANGNVGIGTAAPSQKLDVQGGNINTSGSLMTGGIARIDSSGNLTNIGTISSTYLVTGASYVNLTGSAGLQVGGTLVLTSGRALQNLTGIISSGTIQFTGLIANRLVTTDASSNLITTISSANLAESVLDETGSGYLVFSNSPSISSPTLSGTISGTYTIGGTPTLASSLTGSGSPNITGIGLLSATNLTISGTATTTNLNVTGLTNLATTTISTQLSVPLITTSAGDLTIDPAGNLIVKGSTSDNTTAALNVQNSAGTSLLYVRNDGNVGIGTTAPGSRLEIWGTDVDSAALRIRPSAASTKRVQLAYDNTADKAKLFAYDDAVGGKDLEFQTYGGNVLFPGSGIWQSSGNVGIGTTAPNAPLEVLSTSGSQLRLTYTAGSAYTTFNTDSSGNIYILRHREAGLKLSQLRFQELLV